MRELTKPSAGLRAAWLDAHADWGPGQHEDGFGLMPSDEVESPDGFDAWLRGLADDPVCVYRWIVEDGRVLGGIALRWGPADYVARLGHIGYGVRPSARNRGMASWALGEMLKEAKQRGIDRVLVVCEAGNVASARTIERCGGVGEGEPGRYWIG
jgi:predicted acetyltransferase